jgi:hypothetical protein
MALRDDLIPIVDTIREQVIDVAVGLRLHTVETRLRVWSGGELGRGAATNTDTTLDPKPKVNLITPRLVQASGGKYLDGDRVVEKISATYTEAQLDGGTVATGREFYWLIDDEPYEVVGKPRKGFLGWSIVLRPRRRS